MKSKNIVVTRKYGAIAEENKAAAEIRDMKKVNDKCEECAYTVKVVNRELVRNLDLAIFVAAVINNVNGDAIKNDGKEAFKVKAASSWKRDLEKKGWCDVVICFARVTNKKRNVK